ncbi:carboxypeptidase-like regulatory domain-containing protein [Hymenobacter armeniacus]|uniref:Carboxypeptidase-like regulatory domain-containing protein n=1 Tax=Hymenobacter armeniacus TaxID=2771358 RepID=A0ABR8JYM1_9BACT|nr:carboxypeptidase-like regulatory domain-containing protein [Hymenobacter armeniacus]MBD2724061.1 carboxypeptidase-like regulatory domain-containing protein [Hymenobacter armeniacus]
MKYFRLFAIGCFSLLTSFAAQAQGKLTGVVRDSATNEPLSFASVFLANTTLGVTTTEQGTFVFPKVPAGTYDVVGSYVGYRLAKQSVTIGREPQEVTLKLGATGNQLGEVVVKPAANKPEEYAKFSKLFLGGSTFSAQCRISNPDDVLVLYDDSTKELTAHAKEFVQIDNEALGYRLKYYGLQFSSNDDDRSVFYYGQPVFEELKPKDERQRKLWAANRLTAYKGSFMHFLRSVYNDRLKAEGFYTQQIRVFDNPRYVRAEEQRTALMAAKPNGPYTAAEQDSLDQWDTLAPVLATLNQQPLPIDSIRRVSPGGKRTFLRFNGELQVAYFGETPDPLYKRPMSPLGYPKPAFPSGPRQVSRLKLQGREAQFQANGTLLNPLDVFNGEYWGFEKIGEFLPVDYVPGSLPPPVSAVRQ